MDAKTIIGSTAFLQEVIKSDHFHVEVYVIPVEQFLHTKGNIVELLCD